MKDTQVVWRASLVILIHANTPTHTLFLCLTILANTPAITDPVICRKHLPLQATHERQATLIIRSKYDHLGLAAHSTTVSLCYKTHHWVTHPHTFPYFTTAQEGFTVQLHWSCQTCISLTVFTNVCVLQIPQTYCRAGTVIQAEMSHGACHPTALICSSLWRRLPSSTESLSRHRSRRLTDPILNFTLLNISVHLYHISISALSSSVLWDSSFTCDCRFIVNVSIPPY